MTCEEYLSNMKPGYIVDGGIEEHLVMHELSQRALKITMELNNKYHTTPIYYYEMCGQMKTLLDRLNPLYSTDYSFRDIYMIATAAENDESAFEKAYNGLQGWVDCFEKASLKGMVGGGRIDAANIAASHADVMKKAYELGKKL